MGYNIKKAIFLVVVLLFILILVYVYGISRKKSNINNDFLIHFFNAGKADCTLISNNGSYILIDTGEEELSREILSYLKNNNITKLDYLIITHFDKDHVGSASNIIDNIEVVNVLQSNVPKESTYYTNYINSLNKKGITPQVITGNYDFTIGDLVVTVNGPTTVYENNDSNNSSLIVGIKYGNTSYLFTGDIQNDRIKDYLKENIEKYDFVKIPYHGHYQKKLDDLLEKISPKYAVITSSDEEVEDDETISILQELNISYYLTRKGAIDVSSDGESVVIEQ